MKPFAWFGHVIRQTNPIQQSDLRQIQSSERGAHIEFMEWLLQLSKEPSCLGDFIIEGNRRVKNRQLRVFGTGWGRRCHGVVNEGSCE